MFGSSQGLSVIGGYSMGGDGAVGPDASPSQATKKTQMGDKDSQSLLPVTVRMIEKAISMRSEGPGLSFHGVEAGVVLVVGIVEELNRQQASIDFLLNDSTGRIKARHFFQSAENQLEQVKQGSYISAVGVVKTEPMPHFSIVTLRPVTSPDEISYHAIESAHTKLRMTTSPKTKEVMDTPPPKTRAAAQEMMPMGAPAPAAAPMDQSGGISPPKVALSGSRLQEEVNKFLQEGGARAGPAGLALQEIFTHFQGSADRADVNASLTALCDDGMAYTTIDEEHFLPV